MSFDIRSYGGADPDNMTELTAHLRLREVYGWLGPDVRKWASLLPIREDFPRLMIDPYFLAALIRLLEKDRYPARPPEPAKRESVGRSLGDAWGDSQQSGLNRSMIAKWRSKHVERLYPAGDGNTLGITALTILRILERDGMSMKQFREKHGIYTREEDATSVLNGKIRVNQSVAEEIAKLIDPIESDNHPTPSMPSADEVAHAVRKRQRIPWDEIVAFADWREIPRSGEAFHIAVDDDDFSETAARAAINRYPVEVKAAEAWSRAYAKVSAAMARDKERRAAEKRAKHQ